LVASTADTGDRISRPDLARVLAELAEGGRDAFYQGRFGAALVEVGSGEYDDADLARSQAEWVTPLALRVWGHGLWTVPPPSQGYLALAAARIAELAGDRLAGLAPDGGRRDRDGPSGAFADPDRWAASNASGSRSGILGELPDPDDPAWPHLLIEASRLAAEDRLARLHDGADGAALLAEDRLQQRADRFDPASTAGAWGPAEIGDTMYLCAVDAEGMGVSLIQSNAKDFGCRVAVPGTGILLHNRGTGFSLEAGHPAEYAPGRQPPHTLSPAMATRPDGTLRALLGTMGGDSQPQVVLQMAARLLAGNQEAGDIIQAPRFVLSRPLGTGFDTWTDPSTQVVRIEEHAPPSWASGLKQRGHRVDVAGFDPAGFGHAQLIEVRPDGIRSGAADPRSMTGAAVAAV
ncbi:MAG: gamma-glutamyltransferase, partial [Actinomycetota bacterium]|nr:gamma-glutamyltransferase [Actinomycetota bacterium]